MIEWVDHNPEGLTPVYVATHKGVDFKVRLKGGQWDNGFALYRVTPYGDKRIAGPFLCSVPSMAWGSGDECIMPASTDRALELATSRVLQYFGLSRVKTPAKFKRRRLR